MKREQNSVGVSILILILPRVIPAARDRVSVSASVLPGDCSYRGASAHVVWAAGVMGHVCGPYSSGPREGGQGA